MRGFQWGIAPSLLFFAGRSAFAALERPRPTLVAGLSAAAFNALANYALIFGKLGMPALGIIGSGLATTLSEALMFAVLVAASLIDPRMRRLSLFALPWRLAAREFAALWRLGLPIGSTIVAEAGVFSAATLVMGLIGRIALEAHAIALQVASLAFMVPLGLGQAATVRVGHAYGARDPLAISRAGWSAFGLTVAVRRLFCGGDDRRAAALRSRRSSISARRPTRRRSGSRSRCCGSPPSSSSSTRARWRSPTCCAASHDSRVPLLIALLGYWAIGAPVGVALGFATPLGAVGVWIGLALGLAVVAILLLMRWLDKERRGFLFDAGSRAAADNLRAALDEDHRGLTRPPGE